VEGVRTNRIKLPKPAPYNGILIRDKTWAPIGEPTQRVMNNEFGDRYPVAPRAWYFSSQVGQQSFVNISRGLNTYASTAMVGLTPQETDITGPQRYLKSGGRWFRQDDGLVCIVPEGMAQKLGISDAQVGTATVSVFGTSLKVIGIVRSSRFKNAAKDLDGEVITPVDYLLMQEQQAQQAQTSSNNKMSQDELREYIHLAPDSVLFVPYEFVINAGGTLRSVAIKIPPAEEVRKNLDNLMQRVELNLYAGIEGTTYLCSAVGATSFKGVSDLFIPIFIAAAIVLNTMLGSVYERTREIFVYSSLGLAPAHIAALFVAEAAVYAILGAIAGYLVGQTIAKILVTFNLLTGLNLNYSSLSAVGSTAIIMVTVLLSVIYPAKRASQIAMPGIERRWALPEPENDQIAMKLPFTVTGDQAIGVNMFLREYLAAHADYSLGHFSTADIGLTTYPAELGEAFQ
jgi:ABC-type antimicrobial peptide transport system permease subunit